MGRQAGIFCCLSSKLSDNWSLRGSDHLSYPGVSKSPPYTFFVLTNSRRFDLGHLCLNKSCFSKWQSRFVSDRWTGRQAGGQACTHARTHARMHFCTNTHTERQIDRNAGIHAYMRADRKAGSRQTDSFCCSSSQPSKHWTWALTPGSNHLGYPGGS